MKESSSVDQEVETVSNKLTLDQNKVKRKLDPIDYSIRS
jgi:hypothetical protein